MNKKTWIIIALQALIIVVLFWLLVFYGKDEYEELVGEGEEQIKTASHVVTGKDDDQGAATIALTPASQRQSGILTTRLQATTHQAALSSFGVVVGIESLVELRTRYLAALADANVVRAAMANSQQDYQRLQLLNQDNRNVSDRAVQAAEAVWKGDQARLAAAETQARGIRDNMRQQWGETLAAWAAQPVPGEAFQRLLQYRDVLLKVTLPYDAAPDPHAVLLVAPIGAQGQADKAQWVADSPQTDNTVQGKTFFYRAPADHLRTGMRVTARLNASGRASTTGVVVPHEAVVWYSNKAWAYQKTGADKFVRRAVNTDVEVNSATVNGWFNAAGFKAGDEVVTSGAQLLLSEELKSEIVNENED